MNKTISEIQQALEHTGALATIRFIAKQTGNKIPAEKRLADANYETIIGHCWWHIRRAQGLTPAQIAKLPAELEDYERLVVSLFVPIEHKPEPDKLLARFARQAKVRAYLSEKYPGRAIEDLASSPDAKAMLAQLRADLKI